MNYSLYVFKEVVKLERKKKLRQGNETGFTQAIDLTGNILPDLTVGTAPKEKNGIIVKYQRSMNTPSFFLF